MAVEIHITGETLQSVIADMRALCVGDIRALGEPLGAGPKQYIEAEFVEAEHVKAAQTAAEPAKRTRRTKEQIAADNAAAEAAKAAAGAPAADAAAEAQDAADEQAETEAARAEREPEKKLTHDDCRSVMGAYAKKFGMAAAQEDLSKVWQGAGVQANKVSEIAEADLPKAHAALLAAVESNPFDRKAV